MNHHRTVGYRRLTVYELWESVSVKFNIYSEQVDFNRDVLTIQPATVQLSHRDLECLRNTLTYAFIIARPVHDIA